MPSETLRDAFIDELRDTYDAEKQLTKALPRLAKASTHPELRAAFEAHLEETLEQIRRLEKVFGLLNEKVRGKHCEGMAGIIEEGKAILEEAFEGDTLDACLIAAGQRAEHYEIAAYRNPARVGARDEPGRGGRSARGLPEGRKGHRREALGVGRGRGSTRTRSTRPPRVRNPTPAAMCLCPRAMLCPSPNSRRSDVRRGAGCDARRVRTARPPRARRSVSRHTITASIRTRRSRSRSAAPSGCTGPSAHPL